MIEKTVYPLIFQGCDFLGRCYHSKEEDNELMDIFSPFKQQPNTGQDVVLKNDIEYLWSEIHNYDQTFRRKGR